MGRNRMNTVFDKSHQHEVSPTRRRMLGALFGATGFWSLPGCAQALFVTPPRVVNPCLSDLPEDLRDHALVRAAWRDLVPANVWDCHVHLAGTGDSGSGMTIAREMRSPLYPMQYLQRLFYLNAGCAHDAPDRVDESYVERLSNLMSGMPPGAKLMLYAFDHVHAPDGTPRPERSAFHVPDAYARKVAQAAPHWFEWVCSVHPARGDAIDALEAAAENGARAVKWLPPAMGIDPSRADYDRYYQTLARLDLPLITHVGEEQAVIGVGRPEWGNPLLLRRALDHGVRVVMAHCASHGEDVDLDKGPDGPRVESFELFARMMDEPRAQVLLAGDISATILRNRDIPKLRTLLERDDWHDRLLYGSDYPLPGVMPLISPASFARAGMMVGDAVPVLDRIRQHNPLLFTFVLKRHLSSNGKHFSTTVFETRRFFDRNAELARGA